MTVLFAIDSRLSILHRVKFPDSPLKKDARLRTEAGVPQRVQRQDAGGDQEAKPPEAEDTNAINNNLQLCANQKRKNLAWEFPESGGTSPFPLIPTPWTGGQLFQRGVWKFDSMQNRKS